MKVIKEQLNKNITTWSETPETTTKANNEISWDKINETKSQNKDTIQDINKTNKQNDNILWKEEFEKLKKETKYFPEEMDYDTYVANIQYWNVKTNQAQLKILEERNNK